MLFFLGLALILLHEMDAMRCHEWRIFRDWLSWSIIGGAALFGAADYLSISS
jgi:hypothetical protein